MKPITIAKIFVILLLLSLIIVIWTQADIRQLADGERIRAYAEENFWKGVIAYILIFTAVKFTFVPMTPLTALGGYVFGSVWGTLLATVAITLSSTLMFFIARFLGEDTVRKFTDKRFKRLSSYNAVLERHGFITVIFFRILPVAPLAVVNFGLGLTRVKDRDFILGTFVGVLPGNIFLASIGYRATDYTSPAFLALVGGYILFTAITALIAWRVNHKKKHFWQRF